MKLLTVLLLVSCTPAPVVTLAELVDPPTGPLCVTHGSAESSLSVQTSHGAFRAVAPGSKGDYAAVTFVTDGETDPVVPLASGAVRHQICVKLRAQNGCNVVYACWRQEPTPWVEVQVKKNPWQSTSAECGTNGYNKTTPAVWATVPSFNEPGPHKLEAVFKGGWVEVHVDGVMSWGANLPTGLVDFDGLAGVRSDNLVWFGSLSVVPNCSEVHGE